MGKLKKNQIYCHKVLNVIKKKIAIRLIELVTSNNLAFYESFSIVLTAAMVTYYDLRKTCS